MTELSFPWAGTTLGDAGPYTDQEYAHFYEMLFQTDQRASQGPVVGYLSELAVSGGSSPVSVAAGAAVVDGEIYENSTATTVAIPTPGAATRIDRIVLRKDFTAQTVRITRIAGVEGGGAPSLVQSDNVTWDIPLAQASITTGGVITLTDQRVFAVSGLIGPQRLYEDGTQLGRTNGILDFKDFNAEISSDEAHIYHNLPSIVGGRLTLTSGTPVTVSDVTAAATLYYTIYNHDKISLFDGTRWKVYTFTERSLSVAALSADTNYDIFLYDNAGTLTLESTAWTNATTRATAITQQNGVWVRSGATTRRYLGTIRITSVAGQCEDSANRRFVWNVDNRIERYLRCFETTNTWTYTLTTFRPANNVTTVGVTRVEVVIGLPEVLVGAFASGQAISTTTVFIDAGIGIDSTSANSAILLGAGLGSSTAQVATTGTYYGYPGIGYHYIQWLEASGAAGTTTWFGDNNDPTHVQCGLVASLKG